MTTAVDGGSIPPISTIGRCRALFEIHAINVLAYPYRLHLHEAGVHSRGASTDRPEHKGSQNVNLMRASGVLTSRVVKSRLK